MASSTDTYERTTEDVIAEMLTENTGRHMLDSGGAYGRHWERNRADANGDPVEYFRSRPVATYDRWGGISLDVFHWLSERVTYDAKLDRAWRQWCCLTPSDSYGADVRYYNSPSTAEEFHAQLIDKGYADRDHDFSGMVVNTYNGEDALSQVLQYIVLFLSDDGSEALAENGEGYYALISIHGGCDVRGGYSDLRAFYLGDYDGIYYLLDNAKIEAWCSRRSCGYSASSHDAGYSWSAYDRDTGSEEYSGSSYFGREGDPGYAEKLEQYRLVAPIVEGWHWHGTRSDAACPKCFAGTVNFGAGWVG